MRRSYRIGLWILCVGLSWSHHARSQGQAQAPGNRAVTPAVSDVAKVGDEVVSSREFQIAYRSFVERLPGQPSQEVLRAYRFERQVLEALIAQHVVSGHAGRVGLTVSASEIEEKVHSNPLFLDQGEFIGAERYRLLLAQNNLSVETFEEAIRNQILQDKLLDFATKDAAPADKDSPAKREQYFDVYMANVVAKMQANGEIAVNKTVLATLASSVLADLRPTPVPGAVAAENRNTAPAATPAPARIRGNAQAPVTLREFGDYQCPTCRSYQPIVTEILRRYPSQLKLEFHHFPLIQVHVNAVTAALAAEAAGDQGKFWEMHDLLFETQSSWAQTPNAEEFFKSLAVRLGLDTNQFQQSIRADATRDRVLADVTQGVDAPIEGTPTFFLNGRRVEGSPTVDDLAKLIESGLKPASK